MKFVIALVALVAVCQAAVIKVDPKYQEWDSFKSTYGKSYDTPEEEQHRMQVFFGNLQEINEHNKLYDEGKVTWTMGVNKFADLTHDEFAKQMLDPIVQRRFMV